MKTFIPAALSLLVATAALGQAESRGPTLSSLGGATTGSNTFTGTQSSSVASGANAFSAANSGARFDLGTGANDYLYSDGTGILTPGALTLGSGLTAGTAALNLTALTYICFDYPTCTNQIRWDSAQVTLSTSNGFSIGGASGVAAVLFRGQSNNTAKLYSSGADSASVVAGAVDTANAFTTAGAKLFSFRNAGTEKAYVDKDGALNLGGGLTVGGQMIMPSLTSISWGGGVSIQNGSGQYTGFSRALPDGTVWPIPAVLFHTGTVGANSGSTETTLVTNTHNNQFGNDADVNGRGFWVRASGTFAANTNTKTIKLKYGPAQTDATGGTFTTTANGGGWELDCRIVRLTSNTTQHITCKFLSGAGTLVYVSASGAENFGTNDWAMNLTGTGSATNDIANALMRIDFLP